MNIIEATRKASEKNKYITRKVFNGIKIQPTDTVAACIAIKSDTDSCPRWQPHLEDLIAEDWEVVD